MKSNQICAVCAGGVATLMLVSVSMVSLAQSTNTGAEPQPQAQSSNKPTGAKAAQSGAKCCSASPTTKATASAAKPADPNVVACHALEVHTNAQPAITILVFNQKNRDDHERLSDLLKDNEGESVEVKTSDGTWHKASVARLRSCFGRGLLFFSGESSPVEEKADFVLRFPAKKSS